MGHYSHDFILETLSCWWVSFSPHCWLWRSNCPASYRCRDMDSATNLKLFGSGSFTSVSTGWRFPDCSRGSLSRGHSSAAPKLLNRQTGKEGMCFRKWLSLWLSTSNCFWLYFYVLQAHRAFLGPVSFHLTITSFPISHTYNCIFCVQSVTYKRYKVIAIGSSSCYISNNPGICYFSNRRQGWLDISLL